MEMTSKYSPLPGEFVYKNIYWVLWSSCDIIKRIEEEMEFFSDDILVATFPKSGTTLLEEIVWLVLNDADLVKARQLKIFLRIPFIDENYTHEFPGFDGKNLAIDIIDKWPRPRILKTHLPVSNLRCRLDSNSGMKTIIVMRNPKDTAVSMYHFYCGAVDYGPYREGWDNFFNRWIDGWISGGDWLEVTKDWWLERYRPNLKIMFYEDLIKNKYDSIKEICSFFQVDLSTQQINKIIVHTEFESMRANPMTNYENVFGFEESFCFMRKGKIGDWKNWFSDAQNKALENKYNPILEQIGLEFQYE